MRLSSIVCLLSCLASMANAEQTVDQDHPVRIGVLAFRGHDVALQRWNPTTQYLAQEIPHYNFKIIPLTNDDIDRMVKEARVDFVLTNPASYIGLEMEYGVRRLATLIRQSNGGRNTRFGAVIITRSDRNDIFNLQDLKGKTFMAVHRKAFGGWWMAQREMIQQGIDPMTDLKEIRYVGFPQDQIVYAVRDQHVAAGTVRTSVLERMSADGKINLDDFKILNPQGSMYFHHRYSTQLYPEWPIAALRHVPIELAREVSLALLRMPEDSVPNQIAITRGWTAPLDYQPVHALMQELRVGPYTQLGKVSVMEVFSNYTGWIVAIVTTVLLSLVTSCFVLGLNHRLVFANKQLEREVGVHTELEQRLRHQALHDSLTELPNRNLLMDRIHQTIYAAQRDRDGFAIALIDLNRFKRINDTLGHEFGDKVLKQVAERFQEYVRKSDTMARFGGDEFVLLMKHLDKLNPIVALARKCLNTLNEPFVVSGKQFKLNASIGIAVYPAHGTTVDALMRHADLAMYKAKFRGGGIEIYLHEMSHSQRSHDPVEQGV